VTREVTRSDEGSNSVKGGAIRRSLRDGARLRASLFRSLRAMRRFLSLLVPLVRHFLILRVRWNMRCVFCGIVEGTTPATIEYQDDRVVAFRDIHPMAPIHILIVPRKHIPTLNDVASEDVPLLGHCLDVARQLARTLGIADRGYRIVLNTRAMAGQSIYHIHFHLLAGRPLRWPPG